MASRKGWLTPESGATEYECRPVFIPLDDDLSYMAAVNGALNELTKPENWEQFGSVTPEEAAEVMLEMYTQYTQEECGSETPCDPCVIDGDEELGYEGPIRIIRRGAGGHTEELVDGVWETPTGDYEVPPVPARTEPTSDQRKCAAAWNAANVYADLYEEVTDQIAISTAPADVFGVIFDYVIAILGLFAGPTAAAYASLGKTAFDVFLETAEFLANDVWDDTFTDDLACLFYSHTTDTAGVITFNWPDIRQEVSDNLAQAALNFDTQRGLLWGQVGYLLEITAAGGLDIAGSATAVVSPSCADCGKFCTYFSMGDSTGGWFTNASPGGQWTNGVGWQGIVFNASSNKYLDLKIIFPATFVTTFTVVYDKNAGAGANNSSRIRWLNGAAVIGQDLTNATGLNLSRTFTVDATITSIEIVLNNGTNGAVITFEEFTLRGTGENPLTGGEPC